MRSRGMRETMIRLEKPCSVCGGTGVYGFSDCGQCALRATEKPMKGMRETMADEWDEPSTTGKANVFRIARPSNEND